MASSNSVFVRFVFISLVLDLFMDSQQEILLEESAHMDSLHAPIGGTVELPCDVTPSIEDDKMVLVIWYKQGHDSPIYTFDSREEDTSHWSDKKTLSTRASFRNENTPAVLVISNIRPEDSGQYRCRVDFIKSPTKNTRLNLTVLIPPERLIVLNHEGREIKSGVLGPYDERTEVNITCIAVGGRPTARVSWWKAHALLANSEGRAIVSFTVERADLGKEITCQAVTDPSISPLSETFSIDVNLRPLLVRIQGGKRPLTAGQSNQLICQAIGARPKPSMSWWRDGTRLKTIRETVSADGNITNSILTFTPSLDDAGRMISCRAVQPSLSHSTQEDGFQMEIQHVPVTVLELGANLDASKIVEGSDIYLDCRVRANPGHHHVYFTHNGVLVKAAPGVLLANQSLVLQKISRKAAGNYVCSARNSLGDGKSENLILDIKYSPTCKSSKVTVLQAAKGDTVELYCDLDSNPREQISYHWWFNSSTHTKHELPKPNDTNISGTYLYMVNSSADYGWMQCVGSNSVGSQSQPCLFHILPADKPSPLKNCEVFDVTSSSLSVNCIAGRDGGSRQYFILEAFDNDSGMLLANLTNEKPEFKLSDLTNSNALTISVKAFNKKGTSEAVIVTSTLLKYPERHADPLPAKVELFTFIPIIVGAVIVIMVLAIAVTVTICFIKHCNNKKNKKDERPHDETSNTPLTAVVDGIDQNPDIIPLDCKLSDDCSNKSSATDYSTTKPLITKGFNERQFLDPSICNRISYDYNIVPCREYMRMEPLEYRRPGPGHFVRMPSLDQNFMPISTSDHIASNVNVEENRMRQSYDKVYEDWLKYKDSLPLNTSGLLVPEQLLPPEYSNSFYKKSIPNLTHMPELGLKRLHSERGFCKQGICSVSPPVRFDADSNSVYYKKGQLEPGNEIKPTVFTKLRIDEPAYYSAPKHNTLPSMNPRSEDQAQSQ